MPELRFLESAVDDTLDKCRRLRDPEDPFREIFETNSLPPEVEAL